MTDEESTAALKILDGHVGRLREQGFDSVTIFATKYDGKNGTRYWENGSGNYLARFGHVALWVENEKMLHCRKENENQT